MKFHSHIMTFVAFVGLALSAYSFFHHIGIVPGTFCTLNGTFNCDIVNKGIYSNLFGIPISFIGILGYAFLFTASLLKHRNKRDLTLSNFILFSSLCGLGFSLYLTSLEAFALHSWCIICLMSQLSILIITICAFIMFFSERKNQII